MYDFSLHRLWEKQVIFLKCAQQDVRPLSDRLKICQHGGRWRTLEDANWLGCATTGHPLSPPQCLSKWTVPFYATYNIATSRISFHCVSSMGYTHTPPAIKIPKVCHLLGTLCMPHLAVFCTIIQKTSALWSKQLQVHPLWTEEWMMKCSWS